MQEGRDKVSQEAGGNSGSVVTAANRYTTWYEFKKDLEKQLGYSLLNWRWLEAKPKAPLPWQDSHMKAALLAMARLRRLEGGN